MKKNKKPKKEGPLFDTQGIEIYDHSIKAIIKIMPDTLDNKLRDYENCLKSKGNITAEAGLIIALLATLLSVSQFKNFLGLTAENWKSIFVLFLLMSIIKFCRSCIYCLKKQITRENIINDLLNKEKIE